MLYTKPHFTPEFGYPAITDVFQQPDGTCINTVYPFVSAKVVACSGFMGQRLTSIVIECPRWILAEVDTHRVFSRSFASSRAIPTQKMLDRVRRNPVYPSRWGINRPGMQSTEDATPEQAKAFKDIWFMSAAENCARVEQLLSDDRPLHKQWANRLLEPFLTVRGIVTSSEWDNFFTLRLHKDAQPEFLLLAQCIKVATDRAITKSLRDGEWHLPFITAEEYNEYDIATLLMASTARCARASYDNVDGSTVSIEKDQETYNKLITSKPVHASPAEHPAQAFGKFDQMSPWPKWNRSNFSEVFLQYRKVVEVMDHYDGMPGWLEGVTI